MLFGKYVAGKSDRGSGGELGAASWVELGVGTARAPSGLARMIVG
jgi:hypothetical protein